MSTDFIRRIYNEFNKSKKNLRYVKESFIGVYEIGTVLKESENSIINKFNEVILEYYRRLGDDIKAKLCDEDGLPDLFFISFDEKDEFSFEIDFGFNGNEEFRKVVFSIILNLDRNDIVINVDLLNDNLNLDSEEVTKVFSSYNDLRIEKTNAKEIENIIVNIIKNSFYIVFKKLDQYFDAGSKDIGDNIRNFFDYLKGELENEIFVNSIINKYGDICLDYKRNMLSINIRSFNNLNYLISDYIYNYDKKCFERITFLVSFAALYERDKCALYSFETLDIENVKKFIEALKEDLKKLFNSYILESRNKYKKDVKDFTFKSTKYEEGEEFGRNTKEYRYFYTVDELPKGIEYNNERDTFFVVKASMVNKKLNNNRGLLKVKDEDTTTPSDVGAFVNADLGVGKSYSLVSKKGNKFSLKKEIQEDDIEESSDKEDVYKMKFIDNKKSKSKKKIKESRDRYKNDNEEVKYDGKIIRFSKDDYYSIVDKYKSEEYDRDYDKDDEYDDDRYRRDYDRDDEYDNEDRYDRYRRDYDRDDEYDNDDRYRRDYDRDDEYDNEDRYDRYRRDYDRDDEYDDNERKLDYVNTNDELDRIDRCNYKILFDIVLTRDENEEMKDLIVYNKNNDINYIINEIKRRFSDRMYRKENRDISNFVYKIENNNYIVLYNSVDGNLMLVEKEGCNENENIEYKIIYYTDDENEILRRYKEYKDCILKRFSNRVKNNVDDYTLVTDDYINDLNINSDDKIVVDENYMYIFSNDRFYILESLKYDPNLKNVKQFSVIRTRREKEVELKKLEKSKYRFEEVENKEVDEKVSDEYKEFLLKDKEIIYVGKEEEEIDNILKIIKDEGPDKAIEYILDKVEELKEDEKKKGYAKECRIYLEDKEVSNNDTVMTDDYIKDLDIDSNDIIYTKGDYTLVYDDKNKEVSLLKDVEREEKEDEEEFSRDDYIDFDEELYDIDNDDEEFKDEIFDLLEKDEIDEAVEKVLDKIKDEEEEVEEEESEEEDEEEEEKSEEEESEEEEEE